MRVLLWFAVVVCAGLYIATPLRDPDLWWHVVIGRWILAQHTVPTQDYWTMFGAGTPWKAYSWLIEVLFALVERNAGEQGLLLLQTLFAVALAFALCWSLSRIANDYFFGTLLGVFTTASTFSHFTLRPQSLVWIYFALLLVIADRVEREGLSNRTKFAFFGVMLLWANTHLSSILGLAAIVGWLIGRRPWREVASAALCAFLGTLVTPYLGGEWVMFLHTASHPFSFQSIYEFQPVTIAQYVTSFLVIALALLGVFHHHRPQMFDPGKLLACVAFSVGALAVVKFMPFAITLVCAVLACYWAREQASQGGAAALPLLEGFRRLRTMMEKITGGGLVFLVAVVAFVLARGVWFHPLDRKIVPVQAVDYLLEHKLPHPILNPFGNGGYLMYRLADAAGNLTHKVAIDGRTNLISEELWGAFYVALNGRAGWRKFIELVQPQTILWKWESPLTSILQEGRDWCLVFHSGIPTDGYVVFLSRSYYAEHSAELTSVKCE